MAFTASPTALSVGDVDQRRDAIVLGPVPVLNETGEGLDQERSRPLRPEGAEKLSSVLRHGQIQRDVRIAFVREPGQDRPALAGAVFRVLAEERFEFLVRVADALVPPNEANDSPASFLAKKHPPPRIQYKRVTPRFFAVSSYKGDKVWYNRCNFSGRLVHCVLINYPAEEERAWDNVVTRMSLSLSGR
jgi:hypothetical protein